MDFAGILPKGISLVVRVAVSVLVFYYSIGYVGVLISYLTAQHIAPGQAPEGRFYVVFVPGGEDGAPFDSADFRELAKHKGSYLMP